MKKGIMLIVDGTAPELVKDILETEMVYKQERNRVKITFWEDLGSFAPAWLIDLPSLLLLVLLTMPILFSAGVLKDFNNAFHFVVGKKQGILKN